MTIYYAIVEGDPLTSGGNSQVIEGNSHCTIDDQKGRNRAQAYLGHKAWCAACQSIGVIAAGAGISDHLRGIDYTTGGALEAVDGDIVICKCETHPRLIAVYARCCEYVDTGPGNVGKLRSARGSFAHADLRRTVHVAGCGGLDSARHVLHDPLSEW